MPVPSQLGPYSIDREIGRGGMGVVYLGHDTALDRPVAIKALPEHLAQDPERLARFEREARTLAQLNHANVAQIYGVETEETSRYLVLEFVEGDTLADRLDRGALPIDEAIEICGQVASGIEAAHDAGVVHRDLKPANIKITRDGAVKVLDFGLAKSDEATSSSRSGMSQSPTMSSPHPRHSPTQPGAIMGTAAYMSPEQARGRSVDKRTDIWSFGVILYECLTGASPFVGETVSDSIGAILHKEPDLDLLPQSTPPGIRFILRRCLARDRAKRWRDIADVRVELEEAMTGATDDDVVPLVGRTSRRMWLVTVLIALLVGAGAWAATWLSARSRPAPPGQVVRFSLPFADLLDMSGLAFQTLAISPDGSMIVHSAGRSGRTRLYMQRLDEEQARPIPGSEGGRTPFFSRDGQRLGFFAGGQLKWMPVSGGAPLTVASSPGLQYGAEWLPDGSLIYSTSQDVTLSIVSSSGGASRPIEIDFAEKTIGGFRWPRMLPDGKHLLVTFFFALNGVSGPHMVAIELDSGATTVIGRGADAKLIEPDILVYLQGDALLASRFDVDRLELIGQPRSLDILPRNDGFGSMWAAVAPNGTLAYVPEGAYRGSGRLAWVDRGGQVTFISSATGQYYAPRLSPDESRIAYWSSGREARIGIFVHHIRQGRSFPVEYIGTNGGSYPIWSGDGRSIQALCNIESRGWSWQSMRADGSGAPEIVLEMENALLMTSKDPNGNGGIGYEVNPVTNRDIWLVDDEAGSKPLLVTPANERAARISPDGRWYAFVSDRTGQDEVYVSSYPEGEGLHLISIDGGTEPVWSRDGAELFYRNGESMMAVPIEPGDQFVWSRPVELFAGRFLLDYFGNANYDVARDGGRFLMVATEAEEEWEMKVVLNWRSELEAVLPAP